jgi:hypothetical protein
MVPLTEFDKTLTKLLEIPWQLLDAMSLVCDWWIEIDWVIYVYFEILIDDDATLFKNHKTPNSRFIGRRSIIGRQEAQETC